MMMKLHGLEIEEDKYIKLQDLIERSCLGKPIKCVQNNNGNNNEIVSIVNDLYISLNDLETINYKVINEFKICLIHLTDESACDKDKDKDEWLASFGKLIKEIKKYQKFISNSNLYFINRKPLPPSSGVASSPDEPIIIALNPIWLSTHILTLLQVNPLPKTYVFLAIMKT